MLEQTPKADSARAVPEKLDAVVYHLNRILRPITTMLREKLNAFALELLSGTLYIGGCEIAIGTGAPTSTPADGSLYIDKTGVAGTQVYVMTGGSWRAIA